MQNGPPHLKEPINKYLISKAQSLTSTKHAPIKELAHNHKFNCFTVLVTSVMSADGSLDMGHVRSSTPQAVPDM